MPEAPSSAEERADIDAPTCRSRRRPAYLLSGAWFVATLCAGGCADGDQDDQGNLDAAVAEAADAMVHEADAAMNEGPLDAGAIDGAYRDATAPLLDAALPSDGAAPPDAETAPPCGTATPCTPPTSGVALSVTAGSAPLAVRATSTAREGDGRIIETLYDWGEGHGYTDAAVHRYRQPGSFTVTQRVRDEHGQEASAVASVVVHPSDFVPVRFSVSDRSDCAAVSPSGYEVEFTNWGPCGVRSDAAITPGAGVFYFEGRRLTRTWLGGGLGVATSAASLTEQVGSSTQSMGTLAWGPIKNAGGTCVGQPESDSGAPDLGFVVDYRAMTPTIHLLQEDDAGVATVRTSCTMSVSAPLFVFYSGDRARVGYELHLNTGADTTHFPFYFSDAEVRAALASSPHPTAPGAATALVMGFGMTRALPLDTPPTLAVTGATTVALGQTLTLQAEARDAEDGSLDAYIEWVDLASQHHAPLTGRGASFAFTPTTLGRHPIEVSVADGDGLTATQRVMVEVTGVLPQFAPVQLTRDPLTGGGITVSPDGLSVTFRGTDKDGIRANQGIYGRFWYFEVHRDSPIRNMGMGLVLGDGALNPYQPINVPWSCSLNVLGSFWVNLITAGGFTRNELDADYGFAVDYRGEHPIVHILIGGALQATLVLDQVWVPLYPMVYGNPPDAPLMGPDMTLNFGTKPFRLDPRAILEAAGVDASGLELGWGLPSPSAG